MYVQSRYYFTNNGIVFILPRKKQQDSETLVSNIDGPTRPSTLPMCCSIVSPSNLGSLWCARTRIKMLSTPTASTKNGITYNQGFIIDISLNSCCQHYKLLSLVSAWKKLHTNVLRHHQWQLNTMQSVIHTKFTTLSNKITQFVFMKILLGKAGLHIHKYPFKRRQKRRKNTN